MSETRTIWASRNLNLFAVMVTSYEPRWRPRKRCFDYANKGSAAVVSLLDFKAITGLEVEPGEKVGLRINIDIVKREREVRRDDNT